MKLLPVGLRLAGRPVLVVGGGAVALRKIRMILRCAPRVTVISPAVRPEIRRFAAMKKLTWVRRPFGKGMIARMKPVLVFACTDLPAVNEEIARVSDRAGIWVNQVDDPSGSSVHLPAVARLPSNLCLAIFSGGRLPVYVKYLRRRIEKFLGPHVPVELKLLDEFRRGLRSRVDGSPRRKRILTRLVEDGTLERLARRPARQRRLAVDRLLEERT